MRIGYTDEVNVLIKLYTVDGQNLGLGNVFDGQARSDC